MARNHHSYNTRPLETTLPNWIGVHVEVQTDVLTPIQAEGSSSVLNIPQTRQSKLHDCADRAKKVWLRRAVKVGVGNAGTGGCRNV